MPWFPSIFIYNTKLRIFINISNYLANEINSNSDICYVGHILIAFSPEDKVKMTNELHLSLWVLCPKR